MHPEPFDRVTVGAVRKLEGNTQLSWYGNELGTKPTGMDACADNANTRPNRQNHETTTCFDRKKRLPFFADPAGGSAMYVVAPYARDLGWESSWTSPRPERPVLGRLVALAKASAESLVGWLSGEGALGKGPGGWKYTFR